MNKIKLGNFEIGGDKLTILAGPCVIESQGIIDDVAKTLKDITAKLGINYVFKASFDKANRSSIDSFRGPGIEKGLSMLKSVKDKYNVPVITDIHTPEQAEIVAEVADILQIPAFLCRQTDLLVAAAKTGKILNIKKGQFLSPEQMGSLVKKVESVGNHNILLTDRGTSFGYNNLVVDFRSIPIMHKFGYPVVFDATHSVQKPGGCGDSTGGNREFVEPLAKAAVAVGANGLFFEVHPEPDNALSDGSNMLKLDEFETILTRILKVYNSVQEI